MSRPREEIADNSATIPYPTWVSDAKHEQRCWIVKVVANGGDRQPSVFNHLECCRLGEETEVGTVEYPIVAVVPPRLRETKRQAMIQPAPTAARRATDGANPLSGVM